MREPASDKWLFLLAGMWLNSLDCHFWLRTDDFRMMPAMVDATQRIRIRLHHLAKAHAELSSDSVLHGQDKSFALGAGVVRRFLGEDWIDRHFNPDGLRGFFTIDETTQMTRAMAAFRLIDLAEALYNLQDVPGFDECIQGLRDDHVEATFAELDFGRMLYLNRVPFRFVPPLGVKRSDYDIEIIHPNTSQIICADAKCK
jgi:hypothetical protein